MSRIVTFYSYKGGVGRTFGLANVAVLLARRGKRVLVIDWDLEAPGLHRYFRPYMREESLPKDGIIHLLGRAMEDPTVHWEPFVAQAQVETGVGIFILSSGDQAPDYAERVRTFSWTEFFEKRQGGGVLDRWRMEWKKAFDFVLIDSRTGITDSGGVCTVFLPDILVLVFAANEQSFARGIQVAHGVQQSRRMLAVPRPPVAVLPLPGRFDGRDEVDEAKEWLDRFGRELKPFYDDWLPRQFEPRQILELTKVPYVSKFSFGEPLPVVTHGVTDPEFPGFYLENAARLLVSDFQDALQILDPGGARRQSAIVELRTQLAQVPIDEEAMTRALTSAEGELGEGIALAELLNEAGSALLRQGRLESAETCFRRALGISENHPDASSLTASSLTHLGDLLYSMRRFPDAEREYRRVIHMLEHTLPSGEPAIARAYENLGAVLRRTGQLAEAEEMYRRALHLLENTLRPGDSASARAYENLGEVLLEAGQLAEAEEVYRRALDVLERTLGPSDPAIARAYENLGEVLREKGQLSEAEKVYRRALSLLESTPRQDDSTIARAYQNLGLLLRETGQLSEAEEVFRRAVYLLERTLRPGHPAVAVAYENLGAVLRKAKRLSEAEEVYRQALHALVRTLRPSDSAMARAYINLGRVLRETGRLSEAEALYRDGLAAVKSIRSQVMILGKLAEILCDQGQLDEALRFLEKEALPLSEQLGDVRLRTDALLQIANIQLARGDLDQALSVLQNEALPAYERLGNVRGLVRGRTLLATILMRRGRFEDMTSALDHLRWALDTARAKGLSDVTRIERILLSFSESDSSSSDT